MKNNKELLLTDEELDTLKYLNDPIIQKLLAHIKYTNSVSVIDELIEEKLEKYYGNIISNNSLPYVYLFETLNEVIYKHSPQKVENVLKMLL